MLPPGPVALAHRPVRRHEQVESVVGDLLYLTGVPVAGVSDERTGLFGHAVSLEVLEGGVEDRFQMPEVGRVDGDLGGEDDVALVHSSLRVVGLPGWHPLGAHHPGVRVGKVDRALRRIRRHERLAVALQDAPERVTRTCAPLLVGRVGGQVDLVVLLEPTECLE